MVDSLLDRFGDGKAAVWRFSTSAVFLDRPSRQFADKRLGQLAHLWVVRDERRQRAALPPNPEALLCFLQFCQPPQRV